MERQDFLLLIHRSVPKILNGYVQSPQTSHQIDQLIVPPALGQRAGILGAIALAMEAN